MGIASPLVAGVMLGSDGLTTMRTTERLVSAVLHPVASSLQSMHFTRAVVNGRENDKSVQWRLSVAGSCLEMVWMHRRRENSQCLNSSLMLETSGYIV
jgi:hypothetical protein